MSETETDTQTQAKSKTQNIPVISDNWSNISEFIGHRSAGYSKTSVIQPSPDHSPSGYNTVRLNFPPPPEQIQTSVSTVETPPIIQADTITDVV